MKKYIRGDTWLPTLEVTGADGEPLDLTGYTVRYGLKKTRGLTTPYADINSENMTSDFPVTGSGTNAGIMNAVVLDTVSKNIPKGIYWEEFEISNGTGVGKVKKSWQQQVEVIEPVIG